MKKSRLLRTAVIAMALWGWGLAARADLVYDVTGTFGTTVFTGPLNGGTFSGTFDAALPTNSSESITTYSVALISASGVKSRPTATPFSRPIAPPHRRWFRLVPVANRRDPRGAE